MDLRMRAGLLLLLLNLVAASPRLEEDMEKNLLDLAMPPPQLADNPLDREKILSMRKRGGLLQPAWILRRIDQDPKMAWNQKELHKTDLENIFGSISRLVRDTQSQSQSKSQKLENTGQVFNGAKIHQEILDRITRERIKPIWCKCTNGQGF